MYMYLAWQSFDFERTWWMLFKKCILPTKFDIYLFIIWHCGFYVDFPGRELLLTRKLLTQGFFVVKVKSPHGKFYDRRHDLVNCCKISIRNYHGYVSLVVRTSRPVFIYDLSPLCNNSNATLPLVAVTVYYLSGAREFTLVFCGMGYQVRSP